MPEQTQKLNHFTNSVVQEATAETERALRALEEKKAAALATAEDEAKLEAIQHVKTEAARIRAEAGREVSRHLMDCKREIYLRRSEIAREVFAQVTQRIQKFTASPDYPARLESQLTQAVGQFGLVSNVTVALRPCDMQWADQLAQAVKPVQTTFVEGGFVLGGLIAACPEIGQRIDGSYDTALSELTGHFAELFGLSLSDDLADA